MYDIDHVKQGLWFRQYNKYEYSGRLRITAASSYQHTKEQARTNDEVPLQWRRVVFSNVARPSASAILKKMSTAEYTPRNCSEPGPLA
jgi:hypothetical protein